MATVEYKITLLTLDTAAPVGSSGLAASQPWYNKGTFTISDAHLGTVAVTDDDPNFEVPRYTGETMQTLVTETRFGDERVAAGTVLSPYPGSVIQDTQGHQFLFTFPYVRASASNWGTMAGARKAVLITPLPVDDPISGETVYPAFDVNSTFRYVRLQGFGASYPSVSYAVMCFAGGTMIETRSGVRPIEALSAGDMIRTRDNGFRPLRWIGSTMLDRDRLDLQPNLRPILIRAGALAPGVPARDLCVSPQHRVLVRSIIARRMFDEDEILVAAKHLLDLPGIEVLNPADGVTYFHMLFDRHEVVLSDGAWSESLYTGPEALKSVGEAARREILALFPQLADPRFRPTQARRLLSGREGRKLAERHSKNGKQLISNI